MAELSPVKQKILLLLFAGIRLGLTYTPGKQIRIRKQLQKEWKRMNQQKLQREIRTLYRSQLVDMRENSDGTFTMVLTRKGTFKTLKYRFDQMNITPHAWDRKWRLVVFDIPEKLKKARDALRAKLKSLGFIELQKSVLVFPYECQDEIDFVIEFFRMRKFVRYGILEYIDNDLHLKRIFKLS